MVSFTPQMQVSCSSFPEYRLYYQGTHCNIWTRRSHLVGTAVAAIAAVLAAIRLDLRMLVSSLTAGYLICWGGDVFIEQRKPASFQNPIWAFRANMAMVQDVVRGKETGRRDSTHRWSCALCCEALVSVPSLPCRRNRAATTAATLPRRTVPPDADAGPAELTSAAAASCRDAEACATTGDADALLLPAPRLDRPAVGWAPLPWRRAMGAGVVRLPHPRHGRALLCFVVRDPVVCAVARPRTPTLPCPAYASSSLLWEVRAHAPPSGFARSWLVKGRAVPSTVGAGELLAARSLDLTFSALHELLGDAQRCDRVARTFMPAAGLHRAGGMAFSARATATAAGCEAAAPLSAWSGADGTHVGCGGPHGWTADPRSRPAASSMCSATPHRWAGWARAAAARPLLLRGCVGVPESDGVLRRLCEAREVGGSVSAQTASCDAPADSRHGAHHRPSESVAYVPVRLHAALAVACGLADPAAAPACSPTAAA
ncbi:hypothetical protein CGC21_27445 [Leishmania donovani]|uniref:Uncharacterized protein n=1 Tax=Leishmania donovani TaxID=5661 RepID=A0A504Y6G8_LEIDO|nr:hypothetical protein CGC21_27445 [Leishmania donovani]